MPNGIVTWFDPATGDARIVSGRHEYAASASAMEPPTRRAGARVHFDVVRTDGAERAAEVRLRAGRRNAPHHHRAGTLVGAHRPDTKGPGRLDTAHAEHGLTLAAHALSVAGAWARAVATGDIEDALSFYAPDAVVHTDDGDAAGRGHLQRVVSELPVLDSNANPSVRGEEGAVSVSWPASVDGGPFHTRVRVAHGEIAEQWLGDQAAEAATRRETTAGGIPVVVVAEDVDDAAVDYARDRVVAVTEMISDPVLLVRLKIALARDPARTRPATVQAAIDVNGTVVRAHVAAPTLPEATDFVVQRLRDKLDHLEQRREALRRRTEPPAPGEWRHGDLPSARPDYFDRPAEERELVRHKVFVADELLPDEAAFDMDQLDYDFYLFRDATAGDDALLLRADGGYELRHVHRTHDDAPLAGAAYPIHPDRTPAPRLDVADAIERLDTSGERFVFFAEDNGRGAVVYRRYDGHYGLIELEAA